jgi:hypothetical protein
MFRIAALASFSAFRSVALLSAVSVGLFSVASCAGSDGEATDAPGYGTGGFGQPGTGGAPGQPYSGPCPAAIFQPCKACHDGRGTAATPMGLLNWEDFHAPAHTNPGAKVFQVLPTRLRAKTPTPMPPEGQLDANALAAIDQWVQAGAPDCQGFTRRNPPPPPPPGSGGTTPGTGGTTPGSGGITPGSGGTIPGSGGTIPGSGGTIPGSGGRTSGPIDPSFLSPDKSYFIKEPPGDKPVGPDSPDADYCFNIVAHNAQTPLATDPAPFNVKASEFYHAFQFKVPYDKPVWALSTRPIIDNNKVIHHWLLFQMGGGGNDGSHADEIGLQLGNAMLTGWAPGGNPLDMPAGVGLTMPAPGGYLSMENHYANVSGSAQKDRSGVRMCVTYTKPTNPASLTWLGTETIGIPRLAQGTATGTCTSWKKNTEVHVIQTVPHMHRLGKHMKTVINRGGGATKDVIVDKPFAFADQRAYAVDVVVKPTDTITTTCTFENDTTAQVNFGTPTSAEMCYNFVIYYPAFALDGIGGIEGSKNMCLQ